MKDSDLRKLVVEFMAGEVFFSSQVRNQDLLTIVFLPLALGGLEAVLGSPPPSPEEPTAPVVPTAPTAPTKGLPEEDPTLLPKLIAVRKEVAELEYQVGWGLTEEENYKAAMRKLRDLEAQGKDFFEKSQRDVEARWVQDQGDFAKATEAHREACRRYDEDLVVYGKAMEIHKKAQEAHAEAMKEWSRGADDIGVLYSYMKHASPRAINGYPIFSSMGVLHRKDWKKVATAIQRELEAEEKRSKELPLDEDEEDSP
jgi:hypothetical protein